MKKEYDFSKGKRGAVVPSPSHMTVFNEGDHLFSI